MGFALAPTIQKVNEAGGFGGKSKPEADAQSQGALDKRKTVKRRASLLADGGTLERPTATGGTLG
jgi:hypothetical protein